MGGKWGCLCTGCVEQASYNTNGKKREKCKLYKHSVGVSCVEQGGDYKVVEKKTMKRKQMKRKEMKKKEMKADEKERNKQGDILPGPCS